MANKYSMVVVKKAKALFESGKSAKQISNMKHMPSMRTLQNWIEQKHGGEWNVMVRQVRAFVDPHELESGINQYFNSLKERMGVWERIEIWEDGHLTGYEQLFIEELDGNGEPKIKLKAPPTWAGLAISLKVSVSTLIRYRKGAFDTENIVFSEILEMAEDMIRQFNEEMLYNKETVNGAKFILGRAKPYKKDYEQGKSDENDEDSRKLEDWFKEDKD